MSNGHSRRVLITGATSDLAKALIELTADRAEWELLLVSRSSGGLPVTDSRARIERIDGVDLADPRQQDVVRRAMEGFFSGPFSVVHYAGDFWHHKPLVETPPDEIQRMITSHYLTLCYVARAAAPVMKSHRAGRLVAFSCNSVGYSYPDMAPFTAAKAAVESFIRCFANEHAEYGLAATALALPTIRSAKVVASKSAGAHGDYITPKELAHVVADEILPAHPYVTGNVVRLVRYSDTFYNCGYFDRNPRILSDR